MNRHSPSRDLRFIQVSWLVSLPALLTIFGCLSYSQGSDDQQLQIETTLARAQSAALDRHYSEAIKMLRAALRKDPGVEGLQLELGRVYLATGKVSMAERLFTEILEKDPASRDARLELARALA